MMRRAGLLAALTALLVPAVAGTATADAKSKAPVVKRITPKRVFVGETLSIHGKHFRRGVNKNTVAFKRKGAKAVLVSADKGTAKLLRVKLPKRLERVLLVQNGTPVPTPLQVRVLSTRFGKRFTRRSSSPVVGPEKPPAPPKPKEADPNADCDGDGQINKVDTDDDNDLLTDTLEKSLKLDGCKADTDGDEVEDGYEYENGNEYPPYPEKRPYPNGLDSTDGDTDHDGDDLSLREEYDLWRVTLRNGASRTLAALGYSAGEQYSINVRQGGNGLRMPTLAAATYDKQGAFVGWADNAGYLTVGLSDIVGLNLPNWASQPDWWAARVPVDTRNMDRINGVDGEEPTYYDRDQTGLLDDSERDEDADGLSNWSETRGCLSARFYWDGVYDKETPYYLDIAGTQHDDADSDGDGILDGADDQDHDDVPNVMECSRAQASGLPRDPGELDEAPAGRPWKGFVNPFNPCIPHVKSRSCKRIVPTDGAWAPFNAKDEYYLIRN